MSKVEPWRLKELTMLLDELVLILNSGKNPDSGEGAALNLRFSQLRAGLAKAVEEIRERLVEFVN